MKNIIITGAGGNLGKAVTSTFMNNGYRIIATASSEKGKSDIPAGDNVHVYVVDLSDEKQTADFIKRVFDEHKQVDGAILLAGGFAAGNVEKTSAGDIHAQIALNFNTAYNIARPVFTHMLQRGEGRIIFIGSRPALEAAAGKGMVAYGLSKAMLFKLSEYMNAEAKGKNVVTTVIAPSTIDTEANRKSMPDADPAKWVKPSVLAEIMEFIVSEKGTPLRETVLKVYNNA